MYYVYRFLDKSKNVIYVGKSKQDLKQRFRGHLHLPVECYNLVYKIEYIECVTETDMSIKELYYINKYKNNTNYYFNILDIAELPTSVVFNDKWKIYKGPLPSHFSHSLNFKNGYTASKEVRYNKDGSVEKRKVNKKKGISSYVEGFDSDEVDLIINYLIKEINQAQNNNQEQICFRNLVMFVMSINLPLKTSDFLNLKYKDLFDKNNELKRIEIKLSRYHKDIVIEVPLRKNVRKTVLSYTQRYNMTYDINAEDFLFQSRKHQVITPIAWGRIIKDAADSVGITKNINTESMRKAYGLNVYNISKDKPEALLFLGELWGHMREAKIIRFLNLGKDKIDYNYYFGEKYALGSVSLSKIKCLKSNGNSSKIDLVPDTLSKKNAQIAKKTIKSTNKPPKNKRQVLPVEKKLEIIKKNLNDKILIKTLAEEYKVSINTICNWITLYKKYGESGLEDRRYKNISDSNI